MASLHFNTDDVAPRDRAPQWCEWIHQHFGGLGSDLYGDHEFDGEMRSTRAGDVVLTRIEANRHRVLRSADMVDHAEQPYLKIVAPWSGVAAVSQQYREASARDGSWIIYDTTDVYEVENPHRVDHLVVMVPKDEVVDRSMRLSSLMARQMGLSGISRVALETMRHTYQELPSMSPEAVRGAGEMIKQLVRLSLQELAGHESAVTQKHALRDRIKFHIAQHLRDPALTVDSMARSFNCSRRTLYLAFEAEGESLAAYIQRVRLEACVRDLQSKGPHGKPITDVAMSWGFANLSHFSRVFRERTGSSPSEFRRAQQPLNH